VRPFATAGHGGAKFVVGQCAARAFDEVQGGRQRRARRAQLPALQRQRPKTHMGGHLLRQQAHLLGFGQDRGIGLLGNGQAAQAGGRGGGQAACFELPAAHGAAGQRLFGGMRGGRRRRRIAIVQPALAIGQFDIGRGDPIAGLLEQTAGQRQVLPRQLPIAQAAPDPGALHQRQRLLDRRTHGRGRCDGLVVERARLRQQVDGQVGIGQHQLGLQALLRWRAGTLQQRHRQRQLVQRAVVDTAQQLDAPDGQPGLALRQEQPALLGTAQGALVDAQGFVEVELPGQHEGQADVGQDGAVRIAGAREVHRRAAVHAGGLGVAVQPEQQRAQVELDAAGGQAFAGCDEVHTRLLATLQRVFVAAEHGQRHDHGHQGLETRRRVATAAQAGRGRFQRRQGVAKPALGQRGHALGPGGQGRDLGVTLPGCQLGQPPGTDHRARWLDGPRSQALVLQRPGHGAQFGPCQPRQLSLQRLRRIGRVEQGAGVPGARCSRRRRRVHAGTLKAGSSTSQSGPQTRKV
jgi:hypothetical protein